ncbi:hypothetical protein [Anaeromicropila herbilytica]|uniref:Uncharacterized protein n=1 Tax=Anaeromicropila herbilytica TaxID=2785025 RepID=A0A7R7EK94_9FIRM|nr:hypothetical protein [Anaeromicropila herbilytica]BCN30245.1 hypothetical protein bsdtb5_15400 [Anaeromicropila herbilytica]
MEQMNEYIHQIAAIFIFCFAFAILIYSCKKLNNLIITTKETMQNTNTIYEKDVNEEKSELISYYEVVSFLLNDIDTDVWIDGTLLKKYEFSPLSYQYDNVAVNSYRKTDIYDENGILIRVEFHSIHH